MNFAGVNQSFITQANWAAEVAAYLNTLYTAAIAEPTDVNTLVWSRSEAAGLVVWWDDVNSQIRLQVLRAIATTADTFDDDNMLAGCLRLRNNRRRGSAKSIRTSEKSIRW